MGSFEEYDIHTAVDEGLSGASDDEIFAAAQTEGRLLVTQDLDFADMRRFLPGTHAGVILLRLRSPSRAKLGERMLHVFQHEDLESWSRCFVVVTDAKIRVHRPRE